MPEEKTDQCSVCKNEGAGHHAKVMPNKIIFVCNDCLEKAKTNFIFICMNCGASYLRPKALVIARLKNPEMKRAYILCADEQIIQGIDMCVSCDPNGVMNYMDAQQREN